MYKVRSRSRSRQDVGHLSSHLVVIIIKTRVGETHRRRWERNRVPGAVRKPEGGQEVPLQQTGSGDRGGDQFRSVVTFGKSIVWERMFYW